MKTGPHAANGKPDKEGDDRHRPCLDEVDIEAPVTERQRLGQKADKPDAIIGDGSNRQPLDRLLEAQLVPRAVEPAALRIPNAEGAAAAEAAKRRVMRVVGERELLLKKMARVVPAPSIPICGSNP